MVLPDILVGPIVRRVTEKEINVWICTSKPYDLGITIYETALDAKPYRIIEQAIGKGKTLRRLRLGKKLYVYLLQAFPVKKEGKKDVEDVQFPTGVLLAYDICILNAGTDKLGTSILTSDTPTSRGIRRDISLTDEDVLPTIVLQTNSEKDFRALFASCRKLHGSGRDAFVAASMRYKTPYSKPASRPNALLLMGDQIYADDVSAIVLPRLVELSKELIGFQEDLPDKNGNELPPSAYVAGYRQTRISDLADFTTTEGRNHLVRFGEFVAMYLLSWSADKSIWPMAALDKRTLITNYIELLHRNVDPDIMNLLAKRLEEVKNLEDARCGSSWLRKILANTPTYMIFDDHDVTDDWNLTPSWQKTVEKNPLGARIVANALASYMVFQGWGNDPVSFMDNELLTSSEKRFAHSKVTHDVISNYEKELFKFEKWSFVAPTIPPVLFIDSRTRREKSPSAFEVIVEENAIKFQDELGVANLPASSRKKKIIRTLKNPPKARVDLMKYRPKNWRGDELDCIVPMLISPTIADYLKVLLSKLDCQRLIIVTPAPIFDVPIMAWGKETQARTGKMAGGSVAEDDLEGWLTNKRSLFHFIKFLRLINPPPLELVMLSGDVHYAFNAFGKIDGTNFKLFNSSAVKNAPNGFQKSLASRSREFSRFPGITKRLIYLWEDHESINYSSIDSHLPLSNPERQFYKNITSIEAECIPLVENGVKRTDSPVVTECNIGYLYINSSGNSTMVMSDLIVRG